MRVGLHPFHASKRTEYWAGHIVIHPPPHETYAVWCEEKSKDV